MCGSWLICGMVEDCTAFSKNAIRVEIFTQNNPQGIKKKTYKSVGTTCN